jgi:phytoene synthase
MLAQMRLAWWRETLARKPSARPAGDPLLELLARWQGEEAALVAIVEGWEHLLGAAPLGHDDFTRFVDGRAGAFAALARLQGAAAADRAAAAAGRRWALADLATHLGDGRERQVVLDLAGTLVQGRIALPRRLRWLAVLDGLARRSLARGGVPLLASRMDALVALRLGIAGR